MAQATYTINSADWTLIGNNVTSITFQNLGQYPIYINFNSSATPPAETSGLIYWPRTGEVKKNNADLTYVASPNYVFARSASNTLDIFVETA